MLKIMNNIFDHGTNLWGAVGKHFSLGPLVLRIRLTNKCNLSCHYCYVGESLNKKTVKNLDLSEWTKIIDELPPYTILDLTGGEPLMTPHFHLIIRRMLEKKMKVSLITNGTIHRWDIFDTLVDFGLMHFMVSLDGDEERHDKIRGAGSYKKAWETISYISERKSKLSREFPKIVLKVTASEENIEGLHSFIEKINKDSRVNGITLNLLFKNDARNGFITDESIEVGKFQSGNVFNYKDSVKEKVINVLTKIRNEFPHKLSIRPDISVEDMAKYIRNPRNLAPHSCKKHQSVVTLYQDGSLTPCDIGLKIINIRELNYSVSDIFKLSRSQEISKHINTINSQGFPACAGCCLKKHEAIK